MNITTDTITLPADHVLCEEQPDARAADEAMRELRAACLEYLRLHEEASSVEVYAPYVDGGDYLLLIVEPPEEG